MSDESIVGLILLLYFSPVLYQLFLLIKEHKDENKLRIKRFLRIIKYSFFALLFLTFVLGVLSHTNFLDYHKPMTYDKFDQITFEDFRGIEFFKKSLYGNERFAYVVTSIESDFYGDSVIIQSLFHPSRSFVYKKNIKSDELLTHEKYHIKITEIFVRMAKMKISKLKRFDKVRINEILNSVKKEEKMFQKDYDHDTFHSYVMSEQKRYEKKVDSLLTLLKEYEKPKIIINDKN